MATFQNYMAQRDAFIATQFSDTQRLDAAYVALMATLRGVTPENDRMTAAMNNSAANDHHLKESLRLS